MNTQNRKPDPLDSHAGRALRLWTDFLRPELHTFSDADKLFAKQLETSGHPFERIVGKLALLGTNEPEGRGLMDVVEAACADELPAFGKYGRDMIWLLLRLPDTDLNHPKVVKFLGSATKADAHCRGNACLALERVSCAEAVEMLRALAQDEDERVRRNAEVALRSRGIV